MAKNYAFVTVDVFTDKAFAGNPLAVFPDARYMTSKQMQQLAREFNFSESTFVLPPKSRKNTAQVRIFTPRDEIPFDGRWKGRRLRGCGGREKNEGCEDEAAHDVRA